MSDETLYSMRGAAARVKRDRETIRRWVAGGMPVIEIRNNRGTVVRKLVTESDLLAQLRASLAADPTRRKIRNDVPPVR